MEMTREEISLLKRIVSRYCHEYDKRLGYAVLEDDDNSLRHPDVLTLARTICNTSYLLMERWADNETFVHFTTMQNAEIIMGCSPQVIKQSVEATSDYRGVHCIRVDAMTRPFITEKVQTYIEFKYSGLYLTCIRQEDTTSNIGYCLIPQDVKLEFAQKHSISDFMNKYYERDFKQVLIHHGITEDLVNQLFRLEKLLGLSDAVYVLREQVVNGIPESETIERIREPRQTNTQKTNKFTDNT